MRSSIEEAPYTISPSEAFGGSLRRFDTLLGTTLEGNCTLFDAIEQPGPRVSLGGGDLLTNATHRISTALMGVHLPSRAEPIVTAATLYYAGLEEMLPPAFSVRYDPATHATAVEYGMAAPALFERTVKEAGVRVSLGVGTESKLSTSESVVTSRPYVFVEPSGPQSLVWFLDLADRVENFWSLILGASTAVIRMRLHVGKESGSLIERRVTRIGTPRPGAVVQCTVDQLADALERWLSLPEELRPVEGLIYGTIRKTSFFVEAEFLSLAQAIESLHRVTGQNVALMPIPEFQEVVRVLNGLIGFFFPAEPEVRERLRESIAYAYEPKFRTRLEEVTRGLTPSTAAAMLGEVGNFISNVLDTRNFFTHPGIEKKATTVTEPRRLFELNQKLHALSRLLILTYIGFPEDAVSGAVINQIVRLR